MNDQKKWDARMMAVAETAASWSKDPSTKVGCVLTAGGRIHGVGYNGFPAEFSDDPSLYEDRRYKYTYIVHAEQNAIESGPGDDRADTAYVTFVPCCSCVRKLADAGITRIVCKPIDFSGRSSDWCRQWRTESEEAGVLAAEKGMKLEYLNVNP